MKIILPWTRTILTGDGIYGYKKISLEEILQESGKDGKKRDLKFMFARQIAPYNIEKILSLLRIKKTIDESEDKVNKVILDILQWGNDRFSLGNIEKRIFVEPQTLDGKDYYIAVQSKSQLKKNIKIIREVYLDVDKIREMIKGTGLEYMKKSLDYLMDEGKVKDDRINILDFWGLTTLYYIVEVSKHIFGINEYEIRTFYDKMVLINKDKFDIFDISGYKLTFKYEDKELGFRIYDGSHIYEGEAKRYGSGMNSYITLALYSGSGYILLEESLEKYISLLEDFQKSSIDQKRIEEIRNFLNKMIRFYNDAKDITGHYISLLDTDEEELIKRLLKEDGKKLIGKDNYLELISKDKIEYINTINTIRVRFIDKDKIPYIINTIREIYGI
jgi:hypothetical protein